MTTLTEFLEARLTEDEAVARATLIDVNGSGEWRADERPVALTVDLYRVRDINARPVVESVKSLYGDEGPAEPLYVYGEAVAAHVARHDPARVLRGVAAKRAIIKAVRGLSGQAYDDVEFKVLASMAEAWRDHPDHPGEWDYEDDE